MTNYSFGEMIYGRCNVAQVRKLILHDLEAGGDDCEAIEGFVSIMRKMPYKSGVESVFLKAFDKASALKALNGRKET